MAVLSLVLWTAGALLAVATAMPFVPSGVWWVRCWEFPRLQIGLAALVTAVVAVASGCPAGCPGWSLAGGMVLVAAVQLARVYPYTRLARSEVAHARGGGRGEVALTLMVSNVLMSNRDATRLVRLVGEREPDILLAVETDDWWVSELESLRVDFPHVVPVPQDNTYGMVLFSRHLLSDTSVEYLIGPDVPSVQTTVELPDYGSVRFHGVHPKPPAPTEADDTVERDAELVLVGRRASDHPGPVVVAGDMNDVAWSPSTRLFQKVSRLLDPRRGRGLFSTFHAKVPGLRWPLDHVFHSDHFTLAKIERLPPVGSDHFPILVKLVLEPGACARQEAPGPEPGDHDEAGGKIAAAARRHPGGRPQALAGMW